MIKRSPQLHSLFRIGEPGWHDSDDRVGLCVQANRLVQDRRIAAEAPFPQRPTQDNSSVRRGLIVGCREGSSQGRFYAKRWEQVPGAFGGQHFLWKLSGGTGKVVFGSERVDRQV